MPQTHRDLARRWFEEVWNARSAETVHELMAPGARAHTEGGEVVGPDNFLQTRAALLGAFLQRLELHLRCSSILG